MRAFTRQGLLVYLPIIGGLVVGAFIGGVVFSADPAFVGWIFGAGSGLMGGAFVAALATNEPLVGRGSQDPRSITYPGESPPPPGYDDGPDERGPPSSA